MWDAARARLGDGPGTRALIEVLLLHRRLPAASVTAGISAALGAGTCSPDVVAVEARKHADAASGRAGAGPVPAAPAAGGMPRGASVITLPRREAPLPATGGLPLRWPLTTSCCARRPAGEQAAGGA